jgi:hypothetical protein
MLHRKDLDAFMGIDAALSDAARNPNRSQPVPLIDQDEDAGREPPPDTVPAAAPAEPPKSESPAPRLFPLFDPLAWMNTAMTRSASKPSDRDDKD